MSESSKKNIKEFVEIVENCMQLFSYISYTLTFWEMDTIFPGNLIKDCCEQFYTKLDNYIRNR